MAQKKIWKFFQIKSKYPHESKKELTLQLLGSSIEEINNIKRKWEVKKISREIRKKMSLLNSWDYEEFAQKVQIKEITNELFSVLESEEEIIQNFNREYEKIFI